MKTIRTGMCRPPLILCRKQQLSWKKPLFDVVLTDPKTGLVWTANTKIAELAVGASNDTAFKATYVVKQADIDNGTLENTARTEGA